MGVLLTAFEPFGGETLNASLEVARAVARLPVGNTEIDLLALPVVREQCVEAMRDRLRTSPPQAIVMLGEAGYRSRVSVERVAINVDDYRIPDNDGNQPRGERIEQEGPAAYFATLPIASIVQRLAEAAIPAEISNSAGTYICNRLFYSVMHWLHCQGLATPAGFIHLPFLHEQAIDKVSGCPSLARNTLRDAIRLIVEIARDCARENRPR